MKTDLLVGRLRKKEYGTDKYATNIIKFLKNQSIDIKIIGYPLKYHPPLSRLLFVPIYYSVISSIRKRNDSIKHITSQEHSDILNFIELRPSVVTCHDIIPVVLNEHLFLYYGSNKLSLKGLAKADRIIADSNCTKRDIIRYIGRSESTVDVVPLGVDHKKYKPKSASHEVLEKYGISSESKYLLYVGSEHPRKNVEGIIKALYKAKKKCKNLQMIKVGGSGWPGARLKLMKLIENLGLQDDVTFTGYVSEEDLIGLYSMADLFVFPSFYEGFALPVLEAMACGVPVITSNTSSLPEVVGDAGIMVDPRDIDGLSKAIYEVLTDDGAKEDLTTKGLKRARLFSWERTSRETLKVYEEVNN